jgi:tyrosine-protein phosphatase SIW14
VSLVKTVCWILLLSTYAFAGPVPHLYRIADQIYRGNQPQDGEFAGLADRGIKTVLDLRGGFFHAPRERKLVESAGMRYVSVRLSGIFPPRDQQIVQILKVLQDPASLPVFVHCKRGGDRVGLVIACYRMAHDGWTNEQAFQEASDLGLSRWEVLMRRYIRGFSPSRVR